MLPFLALCPLLCRQPCPATLPRPTAPSPPVVHVLPDTPRQLCALSPGLHRAGGPRVSQLPLTLVPLPLLQSESPSPGMVFPSQPAFLPPPTLWAAYQTHRLQTAGVSPPPSKTLGASLPLCREGLLSSFCLIGHTLLVWLQLQLQGLPPRTFLLGRWVSAKLGTHDLPPPRPWGSARCPCPLLSSVLTAASLPRQCGAWHVERVEAGTRAPVLGALVCLLVQPQVLTAPRGPGLPACVRPGVR